MLRASHRARAGISATKVRVGVLAEMGAAIKFSVIANPMAHEREKITGHDDAKLRVV